MIIALSLGLLFPALLLWCVMKRPADLPPGPGPALPLLGHLHLLDKDPRPKFREWRRQYGDVFSLYMGGQLVVVLNGYHVIKEALVKQADVFTIRPSMFITDYITRNRGIAFASGPAWKEQRKVCLEILRSLGMGRASLADKVQQEVGQFVQAVTALQGRPTDLTDLIGVSTSNNICAMVFGRRFRYDDPEFTRYLYLITENFKLLRATNLMNFIPLLRYLPGDLFNTEKVLSNVREMHDSFLKPQIQQHVDEADDTEQDDFITSYIRQIQQRRQHGNTVTSVNEESMLWVVSDLFVAGTETTSTALRWALLYFIHYPDVQEWCYKQISEVITTHRPPSMHDRPELTHVEATVMEVLRKADIAAMSIHHGVAHDAMLRGYRIPEGSVVVPFLDSVLNDEEVWGDPQNFRPQRFIGPQGQIVKREEFIPMSIADS
nr:hypothetical protein BaRGS_009253 [Batillaria attramentaria]